MKSYSDDIPNVTTEEVKRSLRFAENNTELIKDVGVRIVQLEEKLDEKLEHMRRESTRNTMFLTAVGAGVIALLVLHIFGN